MQSNFVGSMFCSLFNILYTVRKGRYFPSLSIVDINTGPLYYPNPLQHCSNPRTCNLLLVFIIDIPDPPTDVNVPFTCQTHSLVVWRPPISLPFHNITHYKITYWKIGVNEVTFFNFLCDEQHCMERKSLEMNIKNLSPITNYSLKVQINFHFSWLSSEHRHNFPDRCDV